MAEHSCPDCGMVHGHDEVPAEEIAGEETEQTRLREEGETERVRIHEEAETERRRIETEAFEEAARVAAEAQTEQTREETDALEAIAAEETEQVEAIVGSEPDGDEGREDDDEVNGSLEELAGAEGDGGKAADTVVVAPAPAAGSDSGAGEVTSISVPPQLKEEAGAPAKRVTSDRTVPAFRRRRMRQR